MKIKLGNKLKIKQKTTLKQVVVAASVAFIIIGISVVVLHLKHPERAMAATCESSYTLDWGIPSTYTVTCGSVNASNWTVKGNTCFYYSPVFNTGGNVGDPYKEVDITVRINQSGNLDGNDTAWVYMMANGVIEESYSKVGDISAAVFSVYLTMAVPAGGTYQIIIKLKNDKTNETWQIKNGDVTTCLRSLVPLPISLADFSAKTNPAGNVNVNWTTFTEVNNDYFTLEHSATGVVFKQLDRIKGAGNSSSPLNYSFLHAKAVQGINYYRLRQTDYDGTNTLSPVIKVAVSKTAKQSLEVRVAPNPFVEKFSVNFSSEADEQVTVRLLNMDGRVVYMEKHLAQQGQNEISCEPASRLAKGNYLVQIANNETVIGTSKVICQ